MSETRKLAAILVADVVGYSRLAGADEERTLARLRGLRSDLIDPAITAHHGRIVKRTGDGSIIEFRSAVDAVRCAIELQSGLVERNAGVPEDRRIQFRVGVHVGDVVEESDGDLMGDGVNVAARLEGVAKPGAICLSEDAYRQVKGRLELRVNDLGAIELKNIAEPIHVYALEVGVRGTAGPAPKRQAAEPVARQRGALWPWAAVATALAIGLTGAGGYAWRAGLAPRLFGVSAADDKLKSAPRLSIVVLPFENLSGDKEQDYFADGITDDLTTDLSRIPDSFVIARNTAFTYKGKPVDAREIGKELGVRYVLEGSVRRDGESVEVNAQLISTETGAHVWADRFESERSKLGKLQFEIVARLAHSLDTELIRAEALRSERDRADNPDAVDLTMRGAALVMSPNADRSAYDDAIRLFERALALDPQNFQAMRNLAAALAVRVGNDWGPPAVDMARAEELLGAASALRPDDSYLHLTRGYVNAVKGQWRPALMEAETAIANDRSNANAYAAAGYYKMHVGRSRDGLADIETAFRLSPHDWEAPTWQTHLCHLRAHLAQWEQAIEQCEKAVASSPWSKHTYGQGVGVQNQIMDSSGDIGPLIGLAAAYAWAGRDTEAKETAAKLLKFDPVYYPYRISWVQMYSDAHDDPTFKAEMARIIEGLRKAGVPD